MHNIEAVAASYAAAVYAKDVQAFLALYDENVVVFDAWDVWAYEGRDAWAAMTRNWFGSLGEERVRVEFFAAGGAEAADWALWHATVRYAAVNAAGEELRSLENRMTWALRKRGDDWRIIHEHSSAPANFETHRVKLKRD